MLDRILGRFRRSSGTHDEPIQKADSSKTTFLGWVRSQFRSGLLVFSPFCVQTYLRLLLFVIGWKFLSYDYAAIAQLQDGPALNALTPAWLMTWVEVYKDMVFAQTWTIQSAQVCVGAVLVLSLITLNRWAVAAGVLGVLHFEWMASYYRPPMTELDFGLSLLLIALLWPGRWKTVFQGGATPTWSATLFGLCLASYVALAYWLTGYSKLGGGNSWLSNCHIECLYFNITAYAGYQLPTWLEPFAVQINSLYGSIPGLGMFGKLVVLIVELLWPLALFSKVTRAIVPLAMFLSHLLIFFTCGALFLPMAVMGFGVVIPWRRIKPLWDRVTNSLALPTSPQVTPTVPLTRFDYFRFGLAMTLACLITLLGWFWHPTNQVTPFINYQLFGFRIAQYSEDKPVVVYRLGKIDQETGKVEPLPVQTAGFFEYLLVSQSQAALSTYVTTKDDQQKEHQLSRVWGYTRCVRPVNSYRWLLGHLAHPPHVIARPPATDQPWQNTSEWRVLKGTFQYSPTQPPAIVWEDTGPLPQLNTPQFSARLKTEN
ncbi:MAG: hypothetical protein ACFCD0_23370 [Gemmataceae bacterium]